MLAEKSKERKADNEVARISFLEMELQINGMDMKCTSRKFEDFRILEHEICA